MTTLLNKLARGWPTSPLVNPNFRESILNKLHPLAPKFAMYVPSSSPYVMRNLVNGRSFDATAWSTIPGVFQGTTTGQALNTRNSGAGADCGFVVDDIPAIPRGTLFVSFRQLDNYTTGQDYIFSHTSNRIYIGVDLDTDQLFVRLGSGANGFHGTINSSEFYSAAFSWAGGNYTLYLNGVKYTGTYTGTPGGSTAGRLFDAIGQWHGLFYHCGLDTRQWTDEELASYCRSPFQMLEPANSSPFMMGVTIQDATGIPVLSLPVYSNVNETDADVGCTVTF